MFGRRCLILAPHTDDGEFGCGGTIARLLDEGAEVHYVALSSAEKSVPKGHPKNVLREEVKVATARLGIPGAHLRLLNFEVRDFPIFRQEILDSLIKIGQEVQPDTVFLPSTYDTHQDHQVISSEGFRAFKKVTILGYELPWNNLTFKTNMFVFLSEEQLERKIAAVSEYKSQAGRPYANADFIRSLARTRGVQIGYTYAEAYEVIRWVVR